MRRVRRRDLGADEIDEAAKDVEAALRMEPSSCYALQAEAELLSKKNEPAIAAERCERIIAIDPRYKVAYMGVAPTTTLKHLLNLVTRNNNTSTRN